MLGRLGVALPLRTFALQPICGIDILRWHKQGFRWNGYDSRGWGWDMPAKGVFGVEEILRTVTFARIDIA